MTAKFAVVFFNGGSITLQTASYCHNYDDPAQAANDVRELLDGSNTEDWDGNEPEYRLTYDYEVERNGGYRWHYDTDVRRIVDAGVLTWAENAGYNSEAFYLALGVRIEQ